MRIKPTHILALILAALFSVPVFAQTATTPFPVAYYSASAFGTWAINSQSPNTYIFQGRSICNFGAQGTSFFSFNTNAPVWIADINTANSEVVTPSAVVNTAGSCGATLAAANSHYTFALKSGTAGLQEAINATAGSAASPALIELDRNWYSQANQVPGKTGASIIASVVCPAASATLLRDITTAPTTFYSCNGTGFVPSATNITPPTVAAGAGAGTGPTITLAGNGSTGTVTLTTGTTPTASATIFTLTWPSIANGGFAYAPNCTINSVGTRPYLTATNASVAGPPAVDTYTASAVALTASVTGYKFSYTCR